jgi:hypothetical protein
LVVVGAVVVTYRCYLLLLACETVSSLALLFVVHTTFESAWNPLVTVLLSALSVLPSLSLSLSLSLL